MHHAYLFYRHPRGRQDDLRVSWQSVSTVKPESVPNPAANAAPVAVSTRARFVDLIEVDAASRAKVDETRDLMDNVQYAPTVGQVQGVSHR